MEITNFKKKRDFEEKLGNYNKYAEGFNELGNKELIISNIEVMQEDFNNLKASGRLKDTDFKHDLLSKYIKDASEYLHKSEPKIQDIFTHYSTCQDFNKIASSLLGGESNV